MITLDEALASGGGVWRSFHCPSHDDHKPSARVNTITGSWVCMVCGSRGHREKYEPPEHMVISRIRRLSEETRMLAESNLNLYDIDGPGQYWLSRFSENACKRFRLGYDQVREKSIYPIRDLKGGLLGIVYRNFPGEKPKYRYPRGVSTSQLLFNYENIEPKSPVVLVEGAPDVIALWEAGIPAVGTYGARLLPSQAAALSRLEPSVVVLAYDQDQAGNIGSGKAGKALGGMGIPNHRLWWVDYNDVGEMPLEIREEIFEKYSSGA